MARKVWEKTVNRKFPILSDPGAQTIRKYGIVHEKGTAPYKDMGMDVKDIALRSTVLVDEEGRERFRIVSASVPQIPKSAEVLKRIRELN